MHRHRGHSRTCNRRDRQRRPPVRQHAMNRVLRPAICTMPNSQDARSRTCRRGPRMTRVRRVRSFSHHQSRRLTRNSLFPLMFTFRRSGTRRTRGQSGSDSGTRRNSREASLRFLFMNVLWGLIVRASRGEVLQVRLFRQLTRVLRSKTGITSHLRLRVNNVVVITFLPPLMFTPGVRDRQNGFLTR